MANINIYGQLNAATADHILAATDNIYDFDLGKYQSEINAMITGTGSGSVDEKIATLKTELEQAILDAQAAIDEYTVNGKKISENPTLAKEDVGLGNVTNDAQVKRSEMGVANGVAVLDANGKIDPSQIDGVVGHVLGLEQFVDADPADVTEDAYYFNTTTNKILKGEDGAWVESDPQAQVLYNRRGADENGHTNTLYRWDGAQMVPVSDPITIGELTGTAYDGGKGAANRAALESIPANTVSSLGAVTPAADSLSIAFKKAAKTDLNFGAEEDDELVIPVATSTAAGLMSAEDKAKLDIALGGGSGTGSITDRLDGVDTSIAEINEYTVNAKKVSENPVLNGADLLLDGFTALPDKAEGEPDYTTDELTPVVSDTVNAAFAKLLRAILEEAKNRGTVTESIENALGLVDGAYAPTATELVGKNITEAIDYVLTQIGDTSVTETVNNAITEAVTNLVNGATAQTLKDLEDALNAEIARATAAEAQALADAKTYVDNQLAWYEGE